MLLTDKETINKLGTRNQMKKYGKLKIPLHSRQKQTSTDGSHPISDTSTIQENLVSKNRKAIGVKGIKFGGDKTADTFLQCGYEWWCEKKDCRKCPRKKTYNNLNLTMAEICVIEDFAVCDLDWFVKEKNKEEVAMMQELMFNVMHKIFKQERKGDFELKGDFKK
jgi:hypothetical protein